MTTVGFTGTQRGMTVPQQAAVQALLHWISGWHKGFWAAHGDCLGADAQFHQVCRRVPGCLGIHGYPCDIDAMRARCAFDIAQAPQAPLVRNRAIVDSVSWLIAAPKEQPYRESLRSGTWSTVRYARKKFAPERHALLIAWPNGIISDGQDGHFREVFR